MWNAQMRERCRRRRRGTSGGQRKAPCIGVCGKRTLDARVKSGFHGMRNPAISVKASSSGMKGWPFYHSYLSRLFKFPDEILHRTDFCYHASCRFRIRCRSQKRITPVCTPVLGCRVFQEKCVFLLVLAPIKASGQSQQTRHRADKAARVSSCPPLSACAV